MSEYSYLPVYGPLSGADFEAQTVSFFERLDKKITNGLKDFDISMGRLKNQVDSALVGVQGNVEDIAVLRSILSQQNEQIVALQNRIRKIEDEALFIEPDWTGK